MAHMFGNAALKYADEGVGDMAIIRVDIMILTGKKTGY